MKKVLRGLCMAVSHTLALPLLIMFPIFMVGYCAYQTISLHEGFGEFKDMMRDAMCGMKVGYKTSKNGMVHYVKTGEW